MSNKFLLAATAGALALAFGAATAAQAQTTTIVRRSRNGVTTTTLAGPNSRGSSSLTYQQQAPTGYFYNGSGITRPLPPIAPGVQRDGQVSVDGSLARAARSGQPLQMINPFAPAKFGDGSDMVNRVPEDPEQRPHGFRLLAFEF
jgi:hypothetical protein